jgi:hypothetical protein
VPSYPIAFARQLSEDRKLTSDFKVRPVSATYVTQRSCSDQCAFKFERHPDGSLVLDENGQPKAGGCYGNTGHTAIWSKRLNTAEMPEGDPSIVAARAEAAAIDRLDGRYDLRLHVFGDCNTNEAARIVSAAVGRFLERARLLLAQGIISRLPRVWTYTHSWQWVDRASWGTDISVLASCETPADVKLATARGYACEMTFSLPITDLPRTMAGLNVVACPQQLKRKADCASCGACMLDGRLRNRAIIGLSAHGATRKVAASIARRLSESN